MKTLLSALLLGALVSSASAKTNKNENQNQTQIQTVYLSEGSSVNVTEDRSGTKTTQDTSFLSQAAAAFSSVKDCSGVQIVGQKKSDGNSINILIDVAKYAVSFDVVSLSDQAAQKTKSPKITIDYEVTGPNNISKASTTHSLTDFAEDVCNFIANSSKAK